MKTIPLLVVFILALFCLCAAPARSQLTVGAPQTLSETRISRTVFEYVMQASVTNDGTAMAKGVTATCTSSSPTTTVVEGTLVIGNVAAQGSALGTDTFTIAHDRTVPFDPAVLHWTITKVPAAPAITAPVSPTNTPNATLTGTAEPGVTVEITGGASTATGTASGTGTFSLPVPLQTNRVNKLFVTAINTAGRSEPVPVDIIHDAVAPSLFIDFPADGAQLTNDTIIVAGRVGDMLSGFMGLNVTVNGQPANVAVGLGQNGSFERGGVPLAMGANTLTATATDVNGNAVSKQITVTRVAITGPRMAVVSGDAQTARVHEKLANPIVVRITNPDGSPFASKVVTFDVTRGDGRLSATGQYGDPSGLMLQVFTDADGYAAAYWTLGGDAGCGNNRVSVTSKDIAGTIFFCASAMPSPPRQLNIGSGNNQRAEAGGLAPEPLRAWVSDSCNGGANVPGNDTMTGGLGNDTYIFNADNLSGTDTVVEAVSGGTSDTVDFQASTLHVKPVDLALASVSQALNGNLSIIFGQASTVENALYNPNNVLAGSKLVESADAALRIALATRFGVPTVIQDTSPPATQGRGDFVHLGVDHPSVSASSGHRRHHHHHGRHHLSPRLHYFKLPVRSSLTGMPGAGVFHTDAHWVSLAAWEVQSGLVNQSSRAAPADPTGQSPTP